MWSVHDGCEVDENTRIDSNKFSILKTKLSGAKINNNNNYLISIKSTSNFAAA